MHRLALLLFLVAVPAGALRAQAWDDARARALAERGTARRTAAGADSALRSYTARAHGTVGFLAQVGPGFGDAPQLVKADELDVEVYWLAPATSKQVIRRWRDGTWLPTDMHYHRDHLGIVVGNFGARIRLGEGDEVRDVTHPLSPAGLERYEFRLVDSVRLRGPGGEVQVDVLEVRPRDPSAPAVLGELSLDAATGDLVRFRFAFTRSAYLDAQLEDITVVLENTRWDGRWWLPWRQEIEIRRRNEWLDFPARGIIRGRWEIGDYEFNVPMDITRLGGPAIGGLARAAPDTGGWDRPLAEVAAGIAGPVGEDEIAAVRQEVGQLVGAHAVSGLPRNRFGISGVSDLLRVNRVQGLALGMGYLLGARGGGLQLRPRVGYGFADGRLTGGLELRLAVGRATVVLDARREIRDVGAWPVISGLANTLSAQFAGHDFGDWVLVDEVAAVATHPVGTGWTLEAALQVGSTSSVEVEAEPFFGEYRPNAAFGIGGFVAGSMGLSRAAPDMLARSGRWGGVSVEAGTGERNPYLRAQASAAARVPAGPGQVQVELRGGVATDELPAWRSFAIGGRGTLVGEAYRAWGGRHAALARLEWQVDLPVPAIPVVGAADTGPLLRVAPFVAAGWAGPSVSGAPWLEADGIRPVAGVALEWPYRLLRLEAGVGLRTGDVVVTLDASPAWWGIL